MSGRPLVVGTVAVLLLGAGCAAEPAAAGGPTSAVAIPSPGTVAEELLILGDGRADRATIAAAVAEEGGVIATEVPQTATYRARFPGADATALAAIRERLRARGIDARDLPVMSGPPG